MFHSRTDLLGRLSSLLTNVRFLGKGGGVTWEKISRKFIKTKLDFFVAVKGLFHELLELKCVLSVYENKY